MTACSANSKSERVLKGAQGFASVLFHRGTRVCVGNCTVLGTDVSASSGMCVVEVLRLWGWWNISINAVVGLDECEGGVRQASESLSSDSTSLS